MREVIRPLMRPMALGAALLLGSLSTAAVAEGIKVGAVNLTKVTEQMPQAEAAQKQLEREFAPRQRELEGQQKELKSLEDRLERDGDVMSESERRGLERDIRSLQRELVRLQREVREDYNIRRNEELRKLLKETLATVAELAKEESYDLVISEGVVYASEQVNLTQKLLDRLKSQFKAAPTP